MSPYAPAPPQVKSPGLAMFLSLVFPGVGQLYNGHTAKAFVFFAAFFGALFYTRQFALPWLNGEGDGAMTNALLWPGYASGWHSNGPT